jgi:hypothetical protein
MLNAIVTDWERSYDRWLGELARRRDAGRASAEEVWPLTNLERIVLIHALMMDRSLETVGVWPAENMQPPSPRDGLQTLVQRLAAHSGRPPEPLAATLEAARASGHLRMRQVDGRVRWEWVDEVGEER